MNDRNAAQRAISALSTSATLVLLFAGCGHRADDINTVQPGYVRKAIFQTADEWYYRRTIAESETTNNIAWEGLGDIPLERIKFRIEENLLIAYRPYEAVPGSQDALHPGAKGFEGAVLAAWPILYHFDIIREYDPQTGNETNQLVENTSDKVWTERPYMRVNFSANMVEGGMFAGWSAWYLNYISTGSYYRHMDSYPTDPNASRFSDDYVEITDTAFLGMDIYSCAEFTGYSYDGFGNCGFGEAKVRHGFRRIPAASKSDYIPRDYPDSVVRRGTDGKPINDPVTGEVLREPIVDRFGFFRTELLTYDRGYGSTETGRLYRAYNFNLWEKHTDGMGQPLPYNQRTPKPVIYYLNAEYPERWRVAAAEVAADYNRVFTGIVQGLKGSAPTKADGSALPMFEIRDNSCNAAHINTVVSNNPDLTFAVARAVCAEGEACADPLKQVGIGNLTKVCTSLESATRDPMTGKSDFDWQRVGDPRFNMIVFLTTAQMSPWGGYGPMHADAVTGETVSATSFLRGFWYEVGASTVVDVIEVMNDEVPLEDVIFGQTVRKQIAQTLASAKRMSSMKPNEAFTGRIRSRMQQLGSTKAERLTEVDPNHQLNRAKRIEGTKVETDYLTDPEYARLLNGPLWDASKSELTEEVRSRTTPYGIVEQGNPYSVRHDAVRREMTNAGFCFLKADVDPHWASLAWTLRDLPRKDRYQVVASRLLKHVMAHELGHNVGLSHNFEGTFDALNYYPEFWDLHFDTDTAKLEGKYEEHRNTSVMEYVSAKGLFSDRLGRYDEAALRFAYANQVQVFNSLGDPNMQAGLELKRWRYLNDYTKLPDHLCGGTCASPDEARRVISDRSWVNFDPQDPPKNEVPYHFCDNTYDRRTPFCAIYDYGANLKEIHANNYTRWAGYFFFNNFSRDRLWPAAWDPFAAQGPAINAMYFTTLVGQYLYYYNALDDTFVQTTDLGQDMLTTVALGLNMAAEVMSTPEPERACPAGEVNGLPVYVPWYFVRDCDQYVPIDSDYARVAEMIELPLGPARPSSLGLTADFVDWQWDYVGSYFDKSNMMWLLGRSRPQFFRFNYDLDARNYNISLFRLFEPELRGFYEKLISANTHLVFFSDLYTLADQFGSYWCRDPQNPMLASAGYFEPRRMIDPELGASLPGPEATCQTPAVIFPRMLRNIPFSGMYWAHVLFSSPLDSELDMGKGMKIFVTGSDDDFPFWDALPPAEKCSIIDHLTGLDYRAVRQPGTLADLGCLLIDKATEAQDNYLQQQEDDYSRERWREWFERLEYARDLSRIFDR